MKAMSVVKGWLFSGLLLFTGIVCWAQKPELSVQTGHSLAVDSVTFSPDGRLLASAGRDDVIKLWDAESGAELRTLSGHGTFIFSNFSFKNSVVFSPDNQTLATGSQDTTVKLWDVATGALRLFKGHSGNINSVAFSPDGKTLVSGSMDNTIRVWNVATGAELRTIKTNAFMLYSVAISPDGKTLASGSQEYGNADQSTLGNAVAKLWDIDTGAELHTLNSGNDLSTIVFNADGKMLATGNADATITLWNVATGTELRTLGAQPVVPGQNMSRAVAFVNGLAFSRDGKTLVSGSYDTTIKLWDIATGSVLRYFSGHTSPVTSVAISPDGKTLASGSTDHAIKLWDFATGSELRTLKGHSSPTSVAFSPDGKTLVDDGSNSTAKLWDISTGTMRTLERSVPSRDSGKLSPDGNTLARITNNTVKLIEVSSGKELRTIRPHSENTYSIGFSPDSSILATGSNMEGPIELWNVSSAEQLPALAGDSKNFILFTFSRDSKSLAGVGGRKTIKLWDVTTGAALHTLKELASGSSPVVGNGYDIIHSVVFSPDGKTIATGNDDSTIKLWDVVSGTQLHTLQGHASYVDSLAFSLDSKYLASGSFDASIKVWDVSSAKELATLIAFDEHDWIVITPDGLFDGSPAAWNKIIWRFNNNTLSYAPVEAFFTDFYYPGLLAEIFGGKHPRAPADISQKDRRQPQLKISLAGNEDSAAGVSTRSLPIRIEVSQALAGAQDVRLFRNGSLVRVWHGDVLKGQSAVTLEATIAIVAGENRLTAYAFNADNVKSSDATLAISGNESLRRKGIAYVLAVGVNQYANYLYNLKYAVADAQDFAEELKRQQVRLGNYERVEVRSLNDQDATKSRILKLLADLAANIQPEDAVIIYFAGHGTAQGNRFYLIPHDLGYSGSRKNLNRLGLRSILAHSISDEELERAIEGIDAGQLLLVIDACNSGQALEAEEKRRGPMNSKGLAQLAYEKGMYILTAAQSYQAALEAAKLGHGYLTYALVEEGLKTSAADTEPQDKQLLLREWLDYATRRVPQMQQEMIEQGRRGVGLEVIFVEGDEKVRDHNKRSLQRPRVFYRRETETVPLVIAKP